ncbi:MAG: hypothetical protein AB1746_05860 [Candidatus Zixiibacteriota bacterium]
MKHLNDDEIQRYLDGDTSFSREEPMAHLEGCPQCRLRMEQYKAIFKELRVDNIPALSPNFAASVMEGIRPEKPVSIFPKLMPGLSYAALFIFGLAVSIYFMGASTLKQILLALSPSNMQEPSFITTYKNYLAGLDVDYSLILAVILVLAVVALIDQMIRRRHQKPISFMI